MEMWCGEHNKMVREFGFEDEEKGNRTRWCSQGGVRCRMSWRNIETVDFDGERN